MTKANAYPNDLIRTSDISTGVSYALLRMYKIYRTSIDDRILSFKGRITFNQEKYDNYIERGRFLYRESISYYVRNASYVTGLPAEYMKLMYALIKVFQKVYEEFIEPYVQAYYHALYRLGLRSEDVEVYSVILPPITIQIRLLDTVDKALIKIPADAPSIINDKFQVVNNNYGAMQVKWVGKVPSLTAAERIAKGRGDLNKHMRNKCSWDDPSRWTIPSAIRLVTGAKNRH